MKQKTKIVSMKGFFLAALLHTSLVVWHTGPAFSEVLGSENFHANFSNPWKIT